MTDRDANERLLRLNAALDGELDAMGSLAFERELRDDPAIAAQLLAHFLSHKQTAIRRALAANDLAAARRLVNGGSNGLDRFTSAYEIGVATFADVNTVLPGVHTPS